MVDLFSDTLTVRDTPGGISDPSTYSGWQRVSRGGINLTTEPSLNDVLYFVDLPSTDKPTHISLINQQIDTGATVQISIGIYAGEKFTKADGTVVQKNEAILPTAFVSTAVFLQNSSVDAPLQVRFDSTGVSAELNRAGESMWQLAGLAVDPFVDMRIGIEIVNGFATYQNGSIAMIINSSYK